MKTNAALQSPLATVEIRTEQDVVGARQRARELARALGFAGPVQTQIATAVSEIARNAFQYANGGSVEYSVATEAHPGDPLRSRQAFTITVSDQGPGIQRLEDIMAGTYRSQSGLGIGVVGTRRLMDRVDIQTAPGATLVTLVKILPPSAAMRSPRELEAIAAGLQAKPASGPLDELQIQNRELVATMEELKKRQEELGRVNRELAETNSGVLALYDELETFNRISVMLASKLELKPLIQSITDVTGSLVDAEFGAFLFWDDQRQWLLYATCGAEIGIFAAIEGGIQEADLFGADFASAGVVNEPDISSETGGRLARLSSLIGSQVTVRSALAVPVLDDQGALTGAFYYASGKPGFFTERSERILTSVATQAVVGIEKARLFQSVTAASEAKDQFFAALSHELRTPLNPALAIISSLHGDSRLPEEFQEDIATVARNIRLEARLIDDLLDFNRLIKGKLELSTEPVDIHPLVENVVQICREELDGKKQKLTVDLAAPHSVIVGDTARIQQVLWNVLKNAIKFTPGEGAISIRTSTVDHTVRVTISDTGRGIEAQSLDRIFDAFDQGRREVASGFGGLGLGLSIARGFVNLHLGNIRASSDGIGKGATITIDFPLTDLPAATAARPSLAPGGISAAGARILLVDDHADTLQSLVRLLARKGFMVTPASSAAEATAAARAASFDLLVSDVGLPDASGLELVSTIASIQTIPAIALSGYGMESDRAESKSAGFQVHITKPVDFDQLLEAIRDLLQAS